MPFAANAKVTLDDDVVAAGRLFWNEAASVQARIDIANPRWGDTATQLVVNNADGSQFLYVFRLKVKNSRITEAEAMLIRNVEEGGLWDLKTLQKPNPNFNTKIRPAEQDSYYDLLAAAEGYWRAFNTNGTPEYHPAPFWPQSPIFSRRNIASQSGGRVWTRSRSRSGTRTEPSSRGSDGASGRMCTSTAAPCCATTRRARGGSGPTGMRSG